MTDREKVISELFKFREEMRTCNSTTYAIASKKVRRMDLIDKTITLLKAQEPMLVKHTTSTIRCPKCNKQITSRGAIHKEIKYCWKCGQAVKWDAAD